MVNMTGFMHGINLGGWLSQCDHSIENYDTFIKEEDFRKISEWGLDHVRVPVDYNLVEADDGSYKQEGFAYIQKAIDWCKKYHLNMILDLHKTYGYSFDAGEKEAGFFDNPDFQERFYRLWEQFAIKFAVNQDMLCFELLNEITDPSYSKKWNDIARKCIQRIRVIAPSIRILVGSYWNNSVSAVKDLDAPYDNNIIYNFHCYEPLLFTHQGGLWVGPNMTADFRFPLKSAYGDYKTETTKMINESCAVNFKLKNQKEIISAAFFEELFESAIRIANERNVSLYCGEYGVINRAEPQEALEWYKMITSVLDKYGIGRAAWCYRGKDFGIADDWISSVREEVIKVL